MFHRCLTLSEKSSNAVKQRAIEPTNILKCMHPTKKTNKIIPRNFSMSIQSLWQTRSCKIIEHNDESVMLCSSKEPKQWTSIQSHHATFTMAGVDTLYSSYSLCSLSLASSSFLSSFLSRSCSASSFFSLKFLAFKSSFSCISLSKFSCKSWSCRVDNDRGHKMYGIKYNCQRGKLGSNHVTLDVELVLHDHWLSIH